MLINLNDIKNLISEGNLSDISRKTGIPRRTLQDWKLGNNDWLLAVENRLAKLQMYIKLEENKMKLNNENILLEENQSYNEFYENKNVKFARVKFAGEGSYTIFENLNFGSRKRKAEWKRDTGNIYPGIVDANPTSALAEFSTTQISKDGNNWQEVSALAKG